MSDENEEVMKSIYSTLNAAYIPYAAVSWNGFDLFGNKKSIEEANRLINEAERVEPLRQRLVQAMMLSTDWMKKHDQLLGFIQKYPDPKVFKDFLNFNLETT